MTCPWPLRRRVAAAALALAIAAGHSEAAHAQAAVERNRPPGPRQGAPTIVGPNLTPASEDATPIGPDLRGVVLLGAADPVEAEGAAGIDAHRVKRFDTPQGAAALRPFIGRPISRRLIAELEAAIAGYYRARGFPFVSLSTPPQELTSGVIRIRVVEFHVGRISATGLRRTSPDYVTGRVRLAPGSDIDTEQLGDDLRWLNRYPFRQTEAVFSPGGELGAADLDLASTETRPWRVYGGYANSGSPSTSWGRGYLGAMVGLPDDIALAYQFTASPDFWLDHGEAFPTSHPRYLSHAASLSVPTAPRQAIEAAFDDVQTDEASGPFDVRLRTLDLNLGYRFAVSSIVRLPGDLVVGGEASRQERTVRFAGAPVLEGAIRVYQVYAGWSEVSTDARGRTSIEVSVHVSPGGLGGPNSDAAFASYTQGRMTDATYAYLDATAARTFRLSRQWEFNSSVYGRFSTSALPDSQRIGLGGPQLVRGYDLDDGAFDSGIVWRNELRTPTFSLLKGRLPDQASPYAFVDAGYGWVMGGPGSGHPVSAGAGADYRLGRLLEGGVFVAYAFTDAPNTRSGTARVQARLTLSY